MPHATTAHKRAHRPALGKRVFHPRCAHAAAILEQCMSTINTHKRMLYAAAVRMPMAPVQRMFSKVIHICHHPVCDKEASL